MPELCEKAEKLIEKMTNKQEKSEEIKIQKPKNKKAGINYKYTYDQSEKNKNYE